MLKYLTVFDPSRASEAESDAKSSLLLYHEFGSELSSTSLNDKLAQIGMIQGMWALTQSLGGDPAENEKIVELDNGEVVVVILVETQFFICLCIDTASNASIDIPYDFFLSRLWYSYKFFVLQYGTFLTYYNIDNDSVSKLTDYLNEHMVPFWTDIYLRPQTIIRHGMDSLFHESYKISELNQDPIIHSSNSSSSLSHNENESWDSILLRDIILDEENQLAVQDIFVYYLPQDETVPKDKYGLLRNFTSDCENINDLSNWIYHLHSVFDTISSHVLAGNAYYKEKPTNFQNNNNHPTTTTPTDSTANINDTNQSTNSRQYESVTNNISSYSAKFLHNLALPISFAYDAVQEMGTTTGVSNSISLFKNYVPSWSTEGNDDSNNNSGCTGASGLHNNNENSEPNQNVNSSSDSNGPRHGFLISPLSSDILPDNYKIKTLNLKFSSQKDISQYNVLFWFYNDILVVIACKPNLNRIWDNDYLIKMDTILLKSLTKLYSNFISEKNLINNHDTFAYILVDKGPNSYEVKSSIPFINISNKKSDSFFKSTFELAVKDNDNNNNANDDTHVSWGTNIMGNILRLNNKDNGQTKKEKMTFLQSVSNEELFDLQKQIIKYIKTMQASQRNKKEFAEERLITLSNGMLCFIRDDTTELMVVITTWTDNKSTGLNRDKNKATLFGSLGKEVNNWWESISQTL